MLEIDLYSPGMISDDLELNLSGVVSWQRQHRPRVGQVYCSLIESSNRQCGKTECWQQKM